MAGWHMIMGGYWSTGCIGSNCPGMYRTVLEFLTLSCVLDAHTIGPGSVGRTAMVVLGRISKKKLHANKL